MRILVGWMLLVLTTVSAGSEPCDCRYRLGQCSAKVTISPDRSEYTVSTSAECASVGVIIDQTSYPSIVQDGSRTEWLQVFHKDRPVKATIDYCNACRTKSSVVAECRKVVRDGYAKCDRKAASAGPNWMNEAIDCFRGAVDAGNACARATVFRFPGEGDINFTTNQDYPLP